MNAGANNTLYVIRNKFFLKKLITYNNYNTLINTDL